MIRNLRMTCLLRWNKNPFYIEGFLCGIIKYMNILKKLVILIAVAIILFIVIGFARAPKVIVPESPTNTNEPVAVIEKENICFYSEQKVTLTSADISWLKATITGSVITGELKTLPAEKDSKVGLFEGIIMSANAEGVRKVDAIWQTRSEGIETPEQLIVNISSDKAEVGFGEMVDRGDGTYVYKTPNAIPYFSSIPVVPCEELNERITVEQYIRKNISTIASAKATLGGTWYVASVLFDVVSNKGTISYEDGHSQKKATFDYSVDTENTVTITNFK